MPRGSYDVTIYQSNYIKLVAIASMVVDHVGVILFPTVVLLRIIGRIAFPLFAYQIGVSYFHTKQVKDYFFRLFGFGVILQSLYVLAVTFGGLRENPWYFNIFFTLSLGLLAIYLFDIKRYWLLLPLFGLVVWLERVGVVLDYGIYGMALVLLLFVCRTRFALLYLVVLGLGIIADLWISRSGLQVYSVLAMLFIYRPLELKVKIPNFAFYLFYPLHLFFLYLLKMFL